MNGYRPTEVLEKNRKLFKNFSFKFKGLEDETLKFYIQCVKDLGAEVSNDAAYTIAEYIYFKNNKDKEHTDLYDITYILHSVEEEKALDINLYRFTDENFPRCINGSTRCYMAKFASKDDCSRLYNKTIFCSSCLLKYEQSCSPEEIYIKSEYIENNYTSSNVDNNMLIDGDESNIENKNVQESTREDSTLKQLQVSQQNLDRTFESAKSASLSRKSDVDNERRSLTSESEVSEKGSLSSENENEVVSQRTSLSKKREINKKRRSLLNESEIASERRSSSREKDVDTERRGSSGESDFNDEEPRKKKQRKLKSDKNNECQNKEVGKVNKDEYDRKIVRNMSKKNGELFTSYHNSKPNPDSVKNIMTRSAKSIKHIVKNPVASTSKEINKKSNSAVNYIRKTTCQAESDSSTYEFSSDEDLKEGITDQSQEDWWLPQDLTDKPVCKIRSCTFEPGTHAQHSLPGRLLSEQEKRIIIKYLIMTDSIQMAKGSKVWTDMINAGFLKHRTHETLRNIIRRTILPNIQDFKLPPHFEQEFIAVRDRK